ncbi:hypothetical protein EDD18DRAFT_1114227 [Armillaria luteobubalina]|uniref:Uncharacterized protein n=1 Tax=Armillaria luteobubalina TaxID=153913 RepID=A0AA39P5R9_9AGAR|nr:hypothetical protein EDD18DRAFT_1114227 [Armillaria luteobubalina]
MYLVGVIPGPGHPSLDAVNHALYLLVDNFLQFWNPGVWFTHNIGPDAIIVNTLPMQQRGKMRRPWKIKSRHSNEGLFKDHCHVVWGIDVQVEGDDGTIPLVPKACPGNDVLQHWISIIQVLKKQLCKATKPILWHVCYDNDLPNVGTKLVEEYCKIERETRLGGGILTEELLSNNIIDKGREYFSEGDTLEALGMYLLKDGYSGPLNFCAWEFRDLRRVTINGIEYSPVVSQLRGSCFPILCIPKKSVPT